MAVASMDHRGIDAVLKDMRQHPEDAKVQEKGCKALANLAVNAGNAVKIGAGGGVEAIVQAMGGHRGSEGVQREGCEAMRFLAINEGLQRRGCEALGHLALKSDTWNSTAFSPLDGANTSATSPPDVSNTSATSPPDGVNTSATSPPDGANTSATSPPDGANTSATIPPDGANTSATSPPDGANTSATIPPDGANTSATSPPDVSKTTDDGSKTTDDGLKTTDQNSTTDPPHDQHQSSTTDPPRVRKTTKSKFFDVNNLLYVAMDCVWDPENCDTSIFMAFFRKQFSECNKHFKFLLAFMRIYSHGAILFLKSFDHILHTFPKMKDFQTFGLEVGFVAVTFYLWQNFIYYHVDKSKWCSVALFFTLVTQHWCGIALLFIENQEDSKVISSEDSGEVLLCLVWVSLHLNFMLNLKLNQPFVELYLMIMEQTIYCRILGNLSTCSSSLCLCGNLLALGGVVYSKMTHLWKYACKNSTLPGLSTFTFFGSGFWLVETFCVLVKRGYKIGLFPLLYTAGDSSWLGTLCKCASMFMILWEFLSTDLLKLWFGGAAILQVLLLNVW
jgi:hypothetical protein